MHNDVPGNTNGRLAGTWGTGGKGDEMVRRIGEYDDLQNLPTMVSLVFCSRLMIDD